MNDLVVQRNNGEVAVNSEVKIVMQDIVSVGVAKMERQLKIKMKGIQEQIEILRKERRAIEKEFEKETQAAMPQNIIDAEKSLELVLKKLEGYKNQVLDYSISADLSREKNIYSLAIKRKDGGSYNNNWELAKGISPFSEKQKALQAKITEIDSEIEKNSEASAVIRRKLHDVDSLERQMKARVIENQIKKTTNGQELLDAIMDQFDSDLEMIG